MTKTSADLDGPERIDIGLSRISDLDKISIEAGVPVTVTAKNGE